nr:unnamed protein product [Naegleria fowleri]
MKRLSVITASRFRSFPIMNGWCGASGGASLGTTIPSARSSSSSSWLDFNQMDRMKKIRNFHSSFFVKQSDNEQKQQEEEQKQQQEYQQKPSYSFKKLLIQSFLLALGFSSITIILALRQYNNNPSDSILDKLLRNMYGPYRNYVELKSDQPEIEETLCYRNPLLSFDVSNSQDPNDVLANLFVKPGLLIKEDLQNVGGKFEVFDDYGHMVDLVWVMMSKDEYLASRNSEQKSTIATREDLLNLNDLNMLEKSLKMGMRENEEIVWLEKINTKDFVSSKEYSKLPESIKQKPNCVLAIIKAPDVYSHPKDYFQSRYGEAGKKITSTPNGDLYRGVVLTTYYNQLIAIGRSYPNQMINFDLARKELSKDEIEKIFQFIPDSQRSTFHNISKQSTSKSYEIIRYLREVLLKLYSERLTLNAPKDE